MRALITGATGFIGSHLTEELLRRGYTVRCLVRKTSKTRWIKDLPIEYTYGDLFDEEALREVLRDVEVVYHLAGITKARTKEEYFRGNHHATRNLLRAIAKTDLPIRRFIHVSSQAAVGPSLEGIPINEETPFHPITTYGVSKMEAEKECSSMMGRIPITIVRPPAVYGPRDTDVFEFFNTINKGLHPLIGFSDTHVSLIHVQDLVKGILLAGEHPAAVGQTYFISSEKYYNWREIGEITAGIMGVKVVRLRIPKSIVSVIAIFAEIFSGMSRKPALLNREKARDIVQESWTCDITKAKRELSFKETLTIEEGIKNTVTWYRSQGWLK